MTGKYEEAAQRGVAFMGLTGPYAWVKTSADQLITHDVEPKGNALQCASCHNSGSQMNLKTLGYALKGPSTQVCAQCHNAKTPRDYVRQHAGHVDNRRYDCSWCHTFSRPERNLIKP